MVDQTLAKSFEKTGEAYDRFRPGFPREAADVIVPADAQTVIDLGAGTGKFTELLVGRVPQVMAVEPSSAMLDVLRAKLPEVRAFEAGAERMPLPDASVDVITVAQAFHWFDRERACAEIARVLVPGGTLGLLWNHSDPMCAWDRAAHRVAHPAVGGSDSTSASALAELPGFELVDDRELHWNEQISRADYLGRWSTVSTFLVADEAEHARMTGEIEQILDSHDDTRGKDVFDLPLVTDVFVYRAV